MFFIKSFGDFTNKIDYTVVHRITRFLNDYVYVYTRLFVKKSMLDFHTKYKVNKINSLIIEIGGQTLDYDDIVRHNDNFKKITNQKDYDITAALLYTNNITDV
jgi:hypothetical protein